MGTLCGKSDGILLRAGLVGAAGHGTWDPEPDRGGQRVKSEGQRERWSARSVMALQ